MKGIFTVLLTFSAGLSAQSSESRPRFEAADVHLSAKTQNPFPRTTPARNGRYEIKTASMVDLIRIAYGFDSDKILGGPNWLELDRFDITAKVPAEADADAQKLMLQSLLADRFQLKVHKETKALPTYALVAGKKPSLKEAAGTEDTGCRPQSSSGASAEGGGRLMMSTNNGPPITISLGPGSTVTYQCRNMTMDAFVSSLRTMIAANLGTNPIANETEIKGAWNFDLKYSLSMFGPMMGETVERIPITAAIEKQLGLKLEERQIPTPVMVVESVLRKPSDNPPGTAEALPPLPVATSFEVASIKPTAPGAMMGRFQMQPGGRLVVENMPLSFAVMRAFNVNNSDQIAGMPPFAQTDRYDINAKVPGGSAPVTNMDMDVLAPLLLDLLKDRFKLAYHKEDREVQTYSLVTAKPKLKKADPEARTSCKNGNPPPGSAPGSRLFTCQNVTMAQFAERLQNIAPGLGWPIADETGLEGTYDVALTFSMRPMMAAMAPPAPPPGSGGGGGAPGGFADRPAGGAGGGSALPNASEPSGGLTIFEAIEKQLGLKLEKQKRSFPVIVIDHLEQKPTEN